MDASPTARSITMPARKRTASEMETEEHVETPSTLHRLRNMWQFANLVQWIYIFGKAAKIDESIDVEVSFEKTLMLFDTADLRRADP